MEIPELVRRLQSIVSVFYTLSTPPPKNGTTLGLFEKQYSFMLLSYLQSFANQGANGSKWGILPDLRCKTIALPLS